MLTYNGKYWIVDAKRVDIWYERFINYKSYRANSSLDWLMMTVFPTVFFAGLFAIAAVHGFNVPFMVYGLLMFCGAIDLIVLLGFVMARRQEKIHGWNFQHASGEYERFEMKLILMPEIRSNRKLLWKYHVAINGFMKHSSNTDTSEWGLDINRRASELEYRKDKALVAKEILTLIGIAPERADEHIASVMSDLNRLESDRLRKYVDAAGDGLVTAMNLMDKYDEEIQRFHQIRQMMASGQ